MKYRKTVKKLSHKKRSRQKSCHTRNRRRSKRGGMPKPTPFIQRLRTLMYHEIFPILSRASVDIHLGRDPNLGEYSITKANERFYRTIMDVPVDDGIKESIRNIREELKDPVKTVDKLISIQKVYEKIMKKLEEEEKRKQSKESIMLIQGKPFTSSSQPISNIYASGFSQSSGIDSVNKENIVRNFVKPPFSTPTRPEYSSEKETPVKLSLKSEQIRRDQDVFSHADDDGQTETPSKILFETETPTKLSPFVSPPPLSYRNNNRDEQQLLSPDQTIKKLIF